jgi:flagellar FliJ protein
VGELLEEAERECATRLALAQRKAAEAELRCQELKRYLAEYQGMFQQRASAGMGVSGMRDYQTFIARLSDAVRQQQELIAQLNSDVERVRLRWIESAARKSAVGKVIAHARSEDRQLEERRTQQELDERAQHFNGAS